MPDNSVVISLVVKDGNASAVVSQVQRQLDALGKSGERAGQSLHGTVSGMQAASTAIRDLNGDLDHNIRAVERFVTIIPGVGAALQAAFPLLGGLAFGAMLANLAVKFSEFNRKTREAPRAIQEGFEGAIVGLQTSTDQLIKHTDEVNDKINRLLGQKPQNNAKLAIDDIRLAADAAASSALEAAKQINALISANKISLGTSLASYLRTGKGQNDTDEAQGTIKSWGDQIAHESFLAQQAGHNGDTQGLQQHTALSSELEQKAIRDMSAKAADMRRTWAAAPHDPNAADPNLTNEMMYEGATSLHTSAVDHAGAKAADDAASTRERELQNAKRLASEAQAAAAKARAEMIKRIDDAFDARVGTDAGDKYLYYNDQASKYTGDMGARFKKTADESYNQVRKEIEEQQASIAERGGFSLQTGAYASGRKSDLSSDLSKDGDTEKGFRSESEATLSFLRNLNQLTAAVAANNFAARQNAIEIAAATGAMSRQDQVLALAKLHTDEYREAQGKLDEAMQNVQANHDSGAMSTADYNEALTGLGVQQQALSAKYAIEHSLDDVQIDSSHLLGAWKQSLDQFVQESQDAAKQIGDIFSSTMTSVNGTLSTTLTAHYHTARERNRAIRNGLSDDVRGSAAKLTNYGLQSAEGSILKGFGFGGKPDGSSNNPLWVKIAGDMASGAQGSGVVGSTVSSFAHKAGGWFSRLLGRGSNGDSDGGSDSGGSDGSSGGGSATDAILAGFQGGFAGGGDLVANRPAMVGEMGPELFLPRSSGTVIPNNMLSGGATTHHWHIDARGANDPAAVDMAVRRGIERAAPAIIAATEARRADQGRRSPLSKRR